MPGQPVPSLHRLAALLVALALTTSGCTGPSRPAAAIGDAAVVPQPAPSEPTSTGGSAASRSGSATGVLADGLRSGALPSVLDSAGALPSMLDPAGALPPVLDPAGALPPVLDPASDAGARNTVTDSGRTSSAESGVAELGGPGERPTISAACPMSRRDLRSPENGATVVAGPTLIAGTSAMAAGRRLLWTVLGASGERLASGSVVADDSGAFSTTVDLTLQATSVVVELSAADVPTLRHEAPCVTRRSSVVVVPVGRWASGASGSGVADGQFGAWRGSPVPIAGSWVDNNDAAVSMWLLQPGAEYATWAGDLDLAVGAIGPGETWAAAARGAYDDRWRRSLQELDRRWAGRPGTVYIRFAHEFNGDWYPWRVTATTVADFRTAWLRYRAIQQQYMPKAELVFAPNSETSGGSGFDWRQAFPGAQYVDVMAVDYYNMYPWTDTVADFQRTALAYDRFGAPRGLQRHLEFARQVGLPFAVSEWGNNARFGDSAIFIEQMHAFFAANAGTGPGQLRYEVLFNAPSSLDSDPYQLYPVTHAPRAAAAYERLF